MSGGARYWNEETQRWEDGDGSRVPASPATPPPPARPEFTPAAPDAPPTPDAPPVPPTGPAGWPGAGGGSAWHGPGAGGAGGAGGAAPEWASGGTGAAWPPAEQPAVPAPAGGVSRRLVWSVLIGAAVVGVAASLVLTLVVGGGDEDDKPPAAANSSPAVTASESPESDPYASPEPSLTAETASPSAPELPAGYELYEDDEQFRIARPVGWSRTAVDSQYGMKIVNYRSADGERRLQVYQVAEASPEESFELYLSDDTPKPDGFEELDLQTVADGEFTGARLEYLADSLKGEPDVGPWHVYDERFVAQDGFIYAIAAYGPDSDGREDELELLTTALAGFCAPYACDPAAID